MIRFMRLNIKFVIDVHNFLKWESVVLLHIHMSRMHSCIVCMNIANILRNHIPTQQPYEASEHRIEKKIQQQVACRMESDRNMSVTPA